MTKDEMLAEYDVDYFLAPFVAVTRKSDGVKGTLMFNHGGPDEPRDYHTFIAGQV